MENRAARLCTASNAFLHTEGAYSSFGRTIKGFGVLRCDAESSAEEVEYSVGATYYVGYV